MAHPVGFAFADEERRNRTFFFFASISITSRTKQAAPAALTKFYSTAPQDSRRQRVMSESQNRSRKHNHHHDGGAGSGSSRLASHTPPPATSQQPGGKHHGCSSVGASESARQKPVTSGSGSGQQRPVALSPTAIGFDGPRSSSNSGSVDHTRRQGNHGKSSEAPITSAGPSPQFPAPVGSSPHQPPSDDGIWPTAQPLLNQQRRDEDDAGCGAAGDSDGLLSLSVAPPTPGGLVHLPSEGAHFDPSLGVNGGRAQAQQVQQLQQEFAFTRSMLPHVQRPALVAVLTSILDDFPQLAPLIRYRCDKAMAAVIQQQQQQQYLSSPSQGGTPAWGGVAELHNVAGIGSQLGSPQACGGSVTPPSQRKYRGRTGAGAGRGGGIPGMGDEEHQDVCGVHGTLRPLKHLVFQPNTGMYECIHGFHCLENSNPPSLCATPQKHTHMPSATIITTAHHLIGGAPDPSTDHVWPLHQQRQQHHTPSPPSAVYTMHNGTEHTARPSSAPHQDVDVAKLQDLLLSVRRLSEAA
jgi:hypothetical protein